MFHVSFLASIYVNAIDVQAIGEYGESRLFCDGSPFNLS